MRPLSALLLLLCGCELLKKVEPPKITLPPIPQIDVKLPLPKTPDGTYLLMELSQARLEIDPTLADPITAIGQCVDQVTYCYSPGTRSLDECVRSVRTCATSTPWMEVIGCCPEACQAGYAAARSAGAQPATALDSVFFEKPDCFPGVANALEGK